METPAVGSVVLIQFPFSDLSGSKKRPALVLATAVWDDPMLCQITSRPLADPTAVEILPSDLEGGTLERISYVRPTKIFTASPKLVTRVIGHLRRDRYATCIDSLTNFLFQARELVMRP